jgi:hypothetical protein
MIYSDHAVSVHPTPSSRAISMVRGKQDENAYPVQIAALQSQIAECRLPLASIGFSTPKLRDRSLANRAEYPLLRNITHPGFDVGVQCRPALKPPSAIAFFCT